MKTIASLALLLGTAVAGNAIADSVNVCVNKKSGLPRFARKCNAKETQSVIAVGPAGTNGAIGPAGPKGETGQQGPAGAGTTVFDANGQKLGLLLRGNSEYVFVYDKTRNLEVRLAPDPIDPSIMRTDTWNTQAYVYASADCSGDPLIVFHAPDYGPITPNNLDFWGPKEIFNHVYAEVTTNETTRQEILSGKYLMLGGQVAKQVNETDAPVTANSSLIRSIKGEFVYDESWYRKSTGCTPLTVTSQPFHPESNWDYNLGQSTWTYNGTSYGTDDIAAVKAYDLDMEKYQLYKYHNQISGKNNSTSKWTRWVFTYANTSAPFSSPVKLPLSFQ
jgi:hypothetical protein